MKCILFLIMACLIVACSTSPVENQAQLDIHRLALAQEHLRQRHWAEADQLLVQISPQFKNKREYVKTSALTSLLAGDTEKALIKHELALQQFPDDAQIHNHYGLALTALGRFEEACQAFEQAVQLSLSASPAPLVNLARCQLRQGEVKKSQMSLNMAKELSNLPYIGLLTELNLVLILGDFGRARQIHTIVQADTFFAQNIEHQDEYACLLQQLTICNSDPLSYSFPLPSLCLRSSRY